MYNLGQIKFVKLPEIKCLTPSTRALFSDKARCFSQSERALYENFIITSINVDFTFTILLMTPAQYYKTVAVTRNAEILTELEVKL